MKLRIALMALVALMTAGSIVSTAGDLLTYEFDDVVLTPSEVTNLVRDISIDTDAIDGMVHDIVDDVVEDMIVSVVDSKTIKTNNVVDLIHANVSGIDTNAVEDISAYTVSNVVSTVALSGRYADLVGRPDDIAADIEALVDSSVERYADGMSDTLEHMSNVVTDAVALFKMHTDSAYSNLSDVVAFSEAAKSNIADMVYSYGSSVETYFNRAIDTVAPAVSNELDRLGEQIVTAEYWSATNDEFKVVSDTVEFELDIYPSIVTNISVYGAPGTYYGDTTYRHGFLKLVLRIGRDGLLSMSDLNEGPIPCTFKVYEYVNGAYVEKTLLFVQANLFMIKRTGSYPSSSHKTFVIQSDGVTKDYTTDNANSFFDWYEFLQAVGRSSDAGGVYVLDTPIYGDFSKKLPTAGDSAFKDGEYLLMAARSGVEVNPAALPIESGATTAFLFAAAANAELYANTACPIYIYTSHMIRYKPNATSAANMIGVAAPPSATWSQSGGGNKSVSGALSEQYSGIVGTNRPIRIRSVGGPVVKQLVPVDRLDGPVLTSNQIERLILDIIGRSGQGE